MELRPGSPAEVGMSSEQIQHVADLAGHWVGPGKKHSALVILVARRGVIVLHEAFGCLTPEPDSPPLKRDTIYPLASLTKPITATAIMILVEDGRLGLNHPVSEYLPEFTGEGKEAVMVHHLLTHTSGFGDEHVDAHVQKKKGSVEIPFSGEGQPSRRDEYLFLGYDTPLWQPPGSMMVYCTYNYELLAEIVQRVSGERLADFARERIFEPLGMQDSYYIVPDSIRHRIVRRPSDAPFAQPESPGLSFAPFLKSSVVGLDSQDFLETPWGSGGAFSTAQDMAIFGQMFLNRGHYGETRILSPASVATMTRDQIPGVEALYRAETFAEASWGLGWDILGHKKALLYGTLHSPEAFGHSGAGGAYMWIDPVYEIVGVYLSVELDLAIYEQHDLYADLFVNVVTAAAVD